MCEQLEDLHDYIQYSFDDVQSFKLAVFLNSGEVQVKFAMGEVDENLLQTLLNLPPNSSNAIETVKNCELDSQFYSKTAGNNTFLVCCSGKSCEKDEKRIKELMHWLMD